MDSESSNSTGVFRTTIWTEVEGAGMESEAALKALEGVIIRYTEPLRLHLAWKFGLSAHDAADVLQDFIHRKILLANILAKASRERGKFRTFLLTALDRFVLSHFRAQNTLKRRPGNALASLDDESSGADCPSKDEDPSTERWALELVNEALRAMEDDCRRNGFEKRWEAFRILVAEPNLSGMERVPLPDLVEKLGFDSPAEVSNTVTTAKRMYRRTLRKVIAEYAGDPADVDAELMELRLELSRIAAKPF